MSKATHLSSAFQVQDTITHGQTKIILLKLDFGQEHFYQLWIIKKPGAAGAVLKKI